MSYELTILYRMTTKPHWKFWVLIATALYIIATIVIGCVFKISQDAIIGLCASDSLMATIAVMLCTMKDSGSDTTTSDK